MHDFPSHAEFKELRRSDGVYVDPAIAMNVCDNNPAVFKGMHNALKGCGCIFLPIAALVTLVLVKWYLGLIILLLTFPASTFIRAHAVNTVLYTAEEDEMFYLENVAAGVIRFKNQQGRD